MLRILLVDDAALLRRLFTRIAATLGHAVVGEAETGAAALVSARALEPDAIVIDGRLGGADIVRLINDLQEAVPESAICVVAALDEPALARLARQAGAAALLRRPYAPSNIREALNALESSRSADRG